MNRLRRIQKLLSLKLIIVLELLSIKIFLLNFILKIGQEKYLFINFVLKTNLWTYKLKDLNGKKIIGSFYEK